MQPEKQGNPHHKKTKEDIGNMPKKLKSYSFEDVNDFVFSDDIHFEDLQNLCLELAVKLENKKNDNNEIQPTEERG